VDIQEVVALAPLLVAQAPAVATHNVVVSPTSRDVVPPTALPPGPSARFAPRLATLPNTWWCRYDDDSNIESLTSGIAASTSTDNNWYTDSGATYHITGELDKLMMHDVYCSNDQIHMANGLGVDITRIGKSIIPTPTHNLTLNNVLHVSSAHKILISIHHFTLDNDTFIEFHPFFFLIKDRKMRNVLLHGWCKGGLYPFPSSASRIQ
jgi:hypothetical protein